MNICYANQSIYLLTTEGIIIRISEFTNKETDCWLNKWLFICAIKQMYKKFGSDIFNFLKIYLYNLLQ